jgi:hypothetical protein
VPLFKNKGDLYIDASTNFVKKADLTAGYAIMDGLGAYVGYSGAYALEEYNTSDTFDTYDKRYSGNMFNFGLGYFLSEKQSEHLRFEIYADYAMGNYKNRLTGSRNEFFNGNYQRIGIMPNIGYTNSTDRLSVAYSLRYSMLSFYNASVSDRNYWDADIDRLNRRSTYRLLEHGVTFRVGGRNVKFQVQGALYHNLDAIDGTNPIPTLNASVMFGVVINPNLLKVE